MEWMKAMKRDDDGISASPAGDQLPRFDQRSAFAAYERARVHFPAAAFPNAAMAVPDLGALEDHYDVFVFDAFGVLNVGERAIPGAAARIEALKAAGKTCLILSNAASYDAAAAHSKFLRLGFSFESNAIVTSRQAALEKNDGHPVQNGWAVLGLNEDEAGALPFTPGFPRTDADFDDAPGFLFLSTLRWNLSLQERLEASLLRRPRSVVIANPDIIAPRETGLSTEPGYFGYRLAERGFGSIAFHGKPFASIYGLVERRFRFPRQTRICMIGDTLHTDILGAGAAGWGTVLATANGMLTGMDIGEAIARSGIVPHHVLPAI